jgi:hypothetical protein
MQVKYGIRTREMTNLERQLQEEWWRSVNQKNVFECFLQDIKKNIFVKKKKKNMNNCEPTGINTYV